ncbi:DUF2809 domain-containing protein [Clostridium algidicarnis]|nr:DUF2809 domain-containing protein [Clostridium algidicarnis]MBU3210253.1 DUF2809 domain-containing protein [Clostridium algidicarnis]MBU3228676.1 DUF2809 domain-containing protein [Clostridium algidicarnis]MBU3251278.1 DUF2809 domain-containing protein [Clostridium algidicarnis]
MNKRNRVNYGILIIIVVLLGIGSRKFGYILPRFIASYLGDTLWGLMIFLVIGFLCNNLNTDIVAISSLIFCFFIEFSQLYHSAFIDSIRSTVIGGLILGFGFLWSDLICYSLGIIIGVLIEKGITLNK